jgi:hypothetical protein
MYCIVGPSSSHTVGPMRAGKIFIADLQQLGLLEKVCQTFFCFLSSAFAVYADYDDPGLGQDHKDHFVSTKRFIYRECRSLSAT